MNPLKRVLLSILAAPGVGSLLRPLRAGAGTIFMLHRFTDPDTGIVGHDPAELGRTLGFLRRRGYKLIALDEMLRRLHEGTSEDLGIAFTLDDGYADQVRIGGPVFAEFDCPATIFVTTGFLDQELWFWWDRIEYVFDHCVARRVAVHLRGERVEYAWDPSDGPARVRQDFTLRCKGLSDEEKLEAIQTLATAAQVDLPRAAPPRYAPMTWDELRAWEARGLSFGPHTVTHPILARTSAEQSQRELAEGWARLRAEARRPAPVFCYPNGQPGDFGAREIDQLRALGLLGAVVGTPGYATTSAMRSSPFTVARFNYPGSALVAMQFVTGIERLRASAGRIR